MARFGATQRAAKLGLAKPRVEAYRHTDDWPIVTVCLHTSTLGLGSVEA